jgi:hypothetical protein
MLAALQGPGLLSALMCCHAGMIRHDKWASDDWPGSEDRVLAIETTPEGASA